MTLPITLVTTFALACSSLASGQCQIQQLLHTNPGDGDFLGNAVSLNGPRVLVGAKGRDEVGFRSGAAYLFERRNTGWVETAKLVPSSAAIEDEFGDAVAQNDDCLLIGARGADATGTNSGSVTVFEEIGGTWLETQVVLPAGLQSGVRFGDQLSVDGDRAVISAEGDGQMGTNAGAAYVFERIAGVWTEQAKIVGSDSAAGDAFGHAVWVSGDRIIVGAQNHDGAAPNAGAAYIFELQADTWVETAKLESSDIAAADRFGREVSLDGTRCIIGSETNDAFATDAGSAYIFELAGGVWTQTNQLTPTGGAAGDFFGHAVSIKGNWAVVGAFTSDLAANDAGAVYVYQHDGTTWNEVEIVVAEDPNNGDRYGRGVTISDGLFATGAPVDDTTISNAGAAYVAALPQSVGQVLCAGVPNSTGMAGSLAATGSPFAADGCLQFTATSVPATALGYMLMSQGTAFVPNFGGSQGTLCLGGSIFRFSLSVLQADSTNTMRFRPDFDQLPQGTTFVSGATWHFQLWHRDGNPGPTSNVTAGLSVSFQ